MKIAFIIFNKMTSLDFIGIYDPVTRLKSMGFMPSLTWDICSYEENPITDDRGLQFFASKVKEPLNSYDILIIPGGFGTRELKDNSKFIEWIKTAKNVKLKVSVCTGSVIFGAAGFLVGKKATTHPIAFEELKPYCLAVENLRIIDEENIITSRGVSSAIDVGLYLVEKLAGRDIREKVATQMDYPYFYQK
jgi:transcriptional regulator GlxA family with amidase domain